MTFLLVISSSNATLFILIYRLCVVRFLYFVLVWCLFDSGWNISFSQVHSINDFASSTLQIWKHWYVGGLNIIIFVGTCTMSFCAINMDVVSFFRDLSFCF